MAGSIRKSKNGPEGALAEGLLLDEHQGHGEVLVDIRGQRGPKLLPFCREGDVSVSGVVCNAVGD